MVRLSSHCSAQSAALSALLQIACSAILSALPQDTETAYFHPADGCMRPDTVGLCIKSYAY